MQDERIDARGHELVTRCLFGLNHVVEVVLHLNFGARTQQSSSQAQKKPNPQRKHVHPQTTSNPSHNVYAGTKKNSTQYSTMPVIMAIT